MSTPIRVPQVGQSAEEATLLEWVVAAGSTIRAGDVVARMETDKVELEVVAPVDGVLGAHRADSGAVCALGSVLAEVLDPGEADAPEVAVRQPMSPRARALAIRLGVDLAGVAGSGPDGLVTEADVQARATTATAAFGDRRVRARHRLGPVPAAMARRTTQAWTTVPHFVQMVDVDLTAAAQVRAVSGATWTDLVVAALAAALATVPRANIAYADGELFEFEDVDIGIAVDTPAGLVVPVVRHASRLTLADLRAAIAEVVDRALTGASRVTDTGRASATVSNLGSAGIRAGVPVLNPPEAMLVFVGDAAPRAVVHDGSVVSRLTCTLSIAYDHRAFAGASAAAVTNAVRAWLEAPPPL